jgi:diguanylate cyclase (GGDEF)-like protein
MTAGTLLSSQLVTRVAQLVGVSRSLPGVLDHIVAAMAEHGYPGCGITLVNERDELYVVAYDGPPDEEILALRLPVGQGIMGKVAGEGRSLLVADLDDPNGPVPANRTVGGHARMRSLLAVPIVADHTVIGVLEVDSTVPGRFDATDQAVFTDLAAVIAGALQDVAPLELAGALLRRRVHEVLVLEETTAALAAVADVDTAFLTVVRYAAIGLDSRPAVLLRLLGGDCWTVVAEYGVGVERARPPAGSGLDLPWLAPSIAGGIGFVPNDKVEYWLGLPSEERGEHSIAAAPVRAGDEFLGALVVASRDARGFDPAELRLLEGMADLAGLAISNADRYRRLAEAADTDVVTHLHNRARFERDLVAHGDSALAILSIDVDRLKVTNDTYGHEAGDAVLEHAGEALEKLVNERGEVARTGADEFAVLLPGDDAASAVALAEELRTATYGLVPPYGMIRVSIGVAAGLPGADPRATWSAADAALDRAKQWGGDRVESAGAMIRPAPGRTSRWDEQIVELIDSRGLDSSYQPIVRLHDRAVVGYEALGRPLGAAPDSSVEGLFAAAHRKGWSRELDWFCRRAAIEGARELPPDVPLFINCSSGALLNPIHDVDQMMLLLSWASRSPDQLVLEITEREVIDDPARLREVLASYRSLGFRFAIDDVGEGRSTLEVLAAAEPEFVKVARSLTVASHLLGPRSAIHALVAFAHSSGATIIAEGIEDERHAELMAAMDIDHGQGWWLGRPARWPQGEVSQAG